MFLEMEAAVPSLEMLFEQYQELEEAEDQKLLRSMALAIASYGSRSQIPKTAEELYVLREQLLSSSNPQHTPKGKKIITEINPEDIENKL